MPKPSQLETIIDLFNAGEMMKNQAKLNKLLQINMADLHHGNFPALNIGSNKLSKITTFGDYANLSKVK